MSPLQFIFQQFIMTIEGPVHGLCYNMMLTPKKARQPAWILVLSFWGIYTLAMSMSWFSGTRVSSFVNLAVSATLCQILLRIFYKEKLQTTIFAYLTLFFMQAVGDILVSSIYILVQGHTTTNYMEDEMISIMITVMTVCSLLEFLGCWLWRKKKGIRTNGLAIAATLMIVMFLHMVFLTAGVVLFQGDYFSSFVHTSTIGICVMLSLLGICFYYQHKQEKANRLEWENLKRLKQSQDEFFRSLEKLERKTSFIRHDHLNILTSVCMLLEKEDAAEARNLLDSYLKRIESAPAEFSADRKPPLSVRTAEQER